MPNLTNLLANIPLLQQNFSNTPEETAKLKTILSSAGWEGFEEDYPFYDIIYLQQDKGFFPILFTAQNPFPEQAYLNKPSFKELLLQLPRYNFATVLLLCTLYARLAPSQIPSAKLTTCTSVPVLDDFLKDTFGYLVYAHQLEQLYCMLTGSSNSEAAKFRKDWNKKVPEVRSVATKMEIIPDYTLAQCLQERTLEESQFVYNANFAGGYNLWKYLTISF